MKYIKLFDKKDSVVQDIIANPSADYPIIALCQDEDNLSFCDTPIVKAKIDITSDEDVSNYIKSDYNIKSLTIDGELKFKKDTWVKYEYQLTQDDFQYTSDFGGTYVFSKYYIYVKLNSGCRNVYLSSNENATQFMLIRPHAYGGYSHQYISHDFVNIDEMKESLFIKQIDDYTYDLTNFYLYYDKINESYSADNLVGVFLADDNGNILTQNLSFECFDVNVGHDPKIHQVTKENALNADINFGPKVSISGEIDINDYILVGFTQNGQLMFGEPLPIQGLIDEGVGNLSNNTLDLDLTGLVGGSSEFSGMGCIYAIVDKSIEGESIEEITEITEFVKDCTITYYETITFFPILSVGEHELEVELLQQQYMPFFNNDLLISLDLRHINGEYINTESMCNGSHKLQKVYLPHNLKNIGAFAFNYCYRLTSIIIPNSVTSIGNAAFYNCTSLTSVTIPDSVTSIASFGFYDCGSLTSVTIPNSVTSIGDDAFCGCTSLTSVTIPDSVTSIGKSVFYSCCGLKSITIPSGVTSIGTYTFYYCESLNSITCLATTAPTLGTNVFYALPSTGTLIYPCDSDYNTWLEQLGWEDTCTMTYDITATFNVTSTTEPTKIANGNAYAISGFTKMCVDDVRVPVTDTYTFDTLGEHTVQYKLTDETKFANAAFSDCTNLTSVLIGEGLESTGYLTFDGCTNLRSVTLPDTVTKIGNGTFSSCRSLSSITIPHSVTSIINGAFEGCTSLTSVTIPSNVKELDAFVFENCTNLRTVTIENGLESIGDRCFRKCTNLTSFVIPPSVKEIGHNVFEYCTSLTEFTIPNTVTSLGEGVFANCSGLTRFDFPSSITTIESYFFQVCTSLTSVTIPSSVTSIGWSAFRNCTSLTEIEIPDSVTSISNCAFSGCTSLTSVTIPDSVTSIGNAAFENCSNLTSVTIGSGVTSIGKSVFYSCSGLKSITIPNGVTSLGKSALCGCKSLTSITCLATTAPTLGDYALDKLPTNGKLYVPSGSDYSSWLVDLGSGWTIEYI